MSTTASSLTAGLSSADRGAFERTAAVLRRSDTGAELLEQLEEVAPTVRVLGEAEWKQQNFGADTFAAVQFGTIYLQRSAMNDPAKQLYNAVTLAHEGKHILDLATDADGTASSDRFTRSMEIERTHGEAAADEFVDQSRFENEVVLESRAFVTGGIVARELGHPEQVRGTPAEAAATSRDPHSDATWDATTAAVIDMPMYNEDGRTGAPDDYPPS